VSGEQSKSQAKRIAIEQGYGNRAPFAIVNGEEFAGPQDLCFAYSQLQARNAELETDLRWARDDRDNWERTATALLDGIEATPSDVVMNHAHLGPLVFVPTEALVGHRVYIISADDLKALREKANG
jgi:hypothetical protein